MPDVTLSRRSALSLVVITLLLSGCSSMINHRTGGGGNGSNPCSGGGGSNNPYKPIICVDDSNPAAPTAPERVEFYDVEADTVGGHHVPSKRPVKVEWYTTSGRGDLAIDFAAAQGCVEKVECNHNGRCFTQARKQTAQNLCTYGVNLNGYKADPIVVVNPCCE